MSKGFDDTIDWYNKHVEEFTASRKAGAVYDMMESFEKLLPKNGKVLDAGCGSGRDTDLFTQHGFNATGVDLSTGLIEKAKQQFPQEKFVVGDMCSLPFGNKEFDGVWSSASLLHFETREDVVKALSEFYRVLNNNGVLYVSVKLQTGKNKTDLEYDKRYDEPRFFQYFTEKEMQEFFKEAGFKVVSSTIEQSRSRAEVQWIRVIGRKS